MTRTTCSTDCLAPSGHKTRIFKKQKTKNLNFELPRLEKETNKNIQTCLIITWEEQVTRCDHHQRIDGQEAGPSSFTWRPWWHVGRRLAPVGKMTSSPEDPSRWVSQLHPDSSFYFIFPSLFSSSDLLLHEITDWIGSPVTDPFRHHHILLLLLFFFKNFPTVSLIRLLNGNTYRLFKDYYLIFISILYSNRMTLHSMTNGISMTIQLDVTHLFSAPVSLWWRSVCKWDRHTHTAPIVNRSFCIPIRAREGANPIGNTG